MAKPELRDHRKFLRLRRLLTEPTPHVIGYLECLWHRGYQTGNPALGDAMDVEAAAEYPGEPGRFTRAAHDAGFLDLDEATGTYSIHDLYEHAPEYAKKRMVRKGHAPVGAMPSLSGHAEPGTEKSPPRGGESGRSGSARSEPHSKSSRAEDITKNQEPRTKNQEPNEGEESPSTPSCPEPARPASGPDAAADQPVMTFPVDGTGPREWHLTPSKLAEYRESFPSVDVEVELRKALQWIRDNPSRRKTRAGMPNFLSGWLGRVQNRNPARPAPTGETTAERAKRVYAEMQAKLNGATAGGG